MQVEFVANASFIVRLKTGKTLLTDPWLTDGAYYGTWCNFPPLSEARREQVFALRPDYIYVSHIHPDHLDPASLGRFPRDTPILIGRLKEPALSHLRRAIERAGFADIRVLDYWDEVELDGARVSILPQFAAASSGAEDQTGYEIDTSIFVRDVDGVTLFNCVDNALQDADAHAVRRRFGAPDIAILPYAGGSFFPQGCPAYSDDEKRVWRDRIGGARLEAFVRHAQIIGARFNIPAAGSYVLGGRIAGMSEYLHQAVPPQIEAAWAQAGAAAEGQALCQMISGDVVDARDGLSPRGGDAWRGHTAPERWAYAASLSGRTLPHDRIAVPAAFAVNWKGMIERAGRNLQAAAEKMALDLAYDVEIVARKNSVEGVPADGVAARFAIDCGAPAGARRFIRFGVDDGLLLMILIGAANWNNIELASLITCERSPDTQDPSIHNLMNWFRI